MTLYSRLLLLESDSLVRTSSLPPVNDPRERGNQQIEKRGRSKKRKRKTEKLMPPSQVVSSSVRDRWMADLLLPLFVVFMTVFFASSSFSFPERLEPTHVSQEDKENAHSSFAHFRQGKKAGGRIEGRKREERGKERKKSSSFNSPPAAHQPGEDEERGVLGRWRFPARFFLLALIQMFFEEKEASQSSMKRETEKANSFLPLLCLFKPLFFSDFLQRDRARMRSREKKQQSPRRGTGTREKNSEKVKIPLASSRSTRPLSRGLRQEEEEKKKEKKASSPAPREEFERSNVSGTRRRSQEREPGSIANYEMAPRLQKLRRRAEESLTLGERSDKRLAEKPQETGKRGRPRLRYPAHRGKHEKQEGKASPRPGAATPLQTRAAKSRPSLCGCPSLPVYRELYICLSTCRSADGARVSSPSLSADKHTGTSQSTRHLVHSS